MHTMPHTMSGMKAHHSLTGSINVYSDCHLEKQLLLEKLLKSYKSDLFIDLATFNAHLHMVDRVNSESTGPGVRIRYCRFLFY